MEVINKEEKPFGLCTCEVQEALRNAVSNGYKVQIYDNGQWEVLGNPMFGLKDRAYKAVRKNTAYNYFSEETRGVRKLLDLKEVVGDWSSAPEWAQYAAVDEDGIAHYHECVALVGKGDFWVSSGERVEISGVFDASNWSTQLLTRPKTLRPWEIHEFIGKYIRVKSYETFCIARINTSRNMISTTGCSDQSQMWWMENGECLKEDGTVGPCGVEV